MDGVRTTNFDPLVLADEILGNRNGSTGALPVPNLATQLAGSGALADAINAVNTKVAQLSAANSEGVKAYLLRATLYANLVPVDGVIAHVVSDPTPGYNGKYRKAGATGAGNWAKFAELDASAVADEVIAARGAQINLVNRVSATDAVLDVVWQGSPLGADLERPGDLGGHQDAGGRWTDRIDEWGRTVIKRASDPDNAADDLYGPSWMDGASQYLVTFGTPGHLVEPGQAWGGVVGKEVDGRPFAIDEFGTKSVLSSSPAVGDVTMGGPYLVKVAFGEPSLGANTVRLFHPASSGGSIFAGPIIVYDLIIGQSLSVGSAATEAYYQMLHRWAGCALMFDRAEVAIADDVRGGNHSMDTQTPTMTERNVVGFTALREVQSSSGYGGQTVASSFADKMMGRIELDVGRPQLRLFTATGAGGASYSELGPGTPWWTNHLNALRVANRIARAHGARMFRPVAKILHGESDHLRYGAAEQIAGSGYYADIMEWWAADNTATKEILAQQADILFLFLAESQRHAGLQITSPVAMLDAMRNHPDKVIVAGPQYPIHATGHGQADAVHLKASGEVIAGEYLARAEYELINRRNRAWRPLHMTAIAWDGASGIEVTVHNAEGTMLVADTATVAIREGWGFTVAVDGVETAVTSVTPISATKLQITLAGVPGSGGTHRGLHYACKGAPTVGEANPLTNTPAGNIRNTRTEQSRIPGFTLHDWLNTDHIAF